MNVAINSIQGSRSLLTLLVIATAIFFVVSNFQKQNFDIRSVSANEAKVLIDSGAVIIDVRSEEKYKQGHIPGAILIPITLLRTGIPVSIAQAKSKPIVVYCNDGVTTGPEGTHLLNKAGYTKAVNVKSGIEGWTGAGLPVQK